MSVAKEEIAARIRKVCAHFCEEEFEALVHRMAEIDVRYRLREDWLIQHLQSSPTTTAFTN